MAMEQGFGLRESKGRGGRRESLSTRPCRVPPSGQRATVTSKPPPAAVLVGAEAGIKSDAGLDRREHESWEYFTSRVALSDDILARHVAVKGLGEFPGWSDSFHSDRHS